MMHLRLFLILTALVECSIQQTDVHPCPHLCSCSLLSVGVEVSCSHFSFSESFPPKVLQLYLTNLTTLPSNLLSSVPHLQTLDLTGNRLVRLPSHIFNHSSLLNLVIKDNRLEEADPDWFSTNSSITWLDLSGNNLTKVSAALFQRLNHLDYLDLSDNNLQVLHPDTFSNLRHLSTLNLAGNEIISLQAATFSNNQLLTQLFLQDNCLQELPAGIFHGLDHLDLLLINKNRLQSLPTGLFHGRGSSFRAVLSGNSWKCDGEMVYLWKWLNTHPGSV